MLGLGEPVAEETDQVRGAGDEVGDTSVDARGVHLDQHLRRRDLWPIDGAQLEHLSRAVAVLDDRTHPPTLAPAQLVFAVHDWTFLLGRA